MVVFYLSCFGLISAPSGLQMWEHMAKNEAESRAADEAHDVQIARIDAESQASDGAHDDQLHALNQRVDGVQELVSKSSSTQQSRVDGVARRLEKALGSNATTQRALVEGANAKAVKLVGDANAKTARFVDEANAALNAKLASNATEAELRAADLMEQLQGYTGTLADLRVDVGERVDRLSESIDEHHRFFSETCEVLDQKTAMLDRKTALKSSSAQPEKIAILSRQMDQLRMSLGPPQSPSREQDPNASPGRGSDVWRAAGDAVLSRTRSYSGGAPPSPFGLDLNAVRSAAPSPDGSPAPRCDFKPHFWLNQIPFWTHIGSNVGTVPIRRSRSK